MYKKSFILSSLVILIALALAACGGEKSKSPYAQVTLRQATRGKVVSKGFKYEFSNPQIVALNNHLGIIREGNLLEFVSGRSLEEKMAGLEGKQFSLGVVKEFSPFVHFRVEHIFTATDTIFISQTGTIDYPHVTTSDKFNRSGFKDQDLGRIRYNETSVLNKLLDSKFYVQTKVVREEEDGRPVFMLVSKDSKYRIMDPGDGTATILKLLVKGNHPFEGGITLTEVEPWASRRSHHIIGNVEVDFVKYGRMVVSG